MIKRQAKSYSIVDHQLLHGGYLGRLTHEALVLYLFLAVVGDSEGRSFYSPDSICKILRMNLSEISLAKNELIKEYLVDYKNPYWRVLTLTYAKRPEENHDTAGIAPLVRQVLKKSEVITND